MRPSKWISRPYNNPIDTHGTATTIASVTASPARRGHIQHQRIVLADWSVGGRSVGRAVGSKSDGGRQGAVLS